MTHVSRVSEAKPRVGTFTLLCFSFHSGALFSDWPEQNMVFGDRYREFEFILRLIHQIFTSDYYLLFLNVSSFLSLSYLYVLECFLAF